MSRLDRLVTLLDSGSTALVRNTAATQLADIQKAHPDELFNLLNRVVPHLRSRTWETRVSATRAISGIVDNADKWDPNADDGDDFEPEVKKEIKDEIKDGIKEEPNDATLKNEGVEDGVNLPLDEGQLSFDTLDIISVLKFGKTLLGSSGKEYDYSLNDLDPAERLAAQKKNVTARLGLGGEYMEEEIVNEKDFASMGGHTVQTPRIDTSVGSYNGRPSAPVSTIKSAMSPMEPPPSATTSTAEEGMSNLSKRQINALKRKAKANAKNHANKVRVVDLGASRRMSTTDVGALVQEAIPHPVKTENGTPTNGQPDYFSLDTTAPQDDTKIAVEYKGPAQPAEPLIQTSSEEMDWPFERLCEILMVDLFDQNWEIRHGAAMGLREVVRVHGAGAGRQRGRSRAENNVLNERWLDDLACRLSCIFMLDRFGDYVSDNVVAPIRETTSQTMGALLLHLSPASVHKVYKMLYRLVMQEDLGISMPIWQVCHGGMLGLKYLSAVRTDMLTKNSELLDGVVCAVMRGLADHDDDVRAVSAATLIPIAAEFITLRPQAVDGLINVVWECLSHLKDDLSASTGSVMDLLAKLCSFPQVLEAMKHKASTDPSQSFSLLVPRLYPFLRHTITSVRSAVLRALLTFLNVEGDGTKGWVDGKVLRLVFQNLLVERNEAVLSLSLQVWTALITELAKDNPERLAKEFSPHLDPLLTLLTTPIGVSRHPCPMDPSLFIRPSGQTLVLPGIVVPPRGHSPTQPAQEPERKRRRKSEKKEEPVSVGHNVDGHMIQGDVDLVGVDTIHKTKIAGATAMGLAMSLWPRDTAQSVFEPRLVPHLKSPYASTQLVAAMTIEEFYKSQTEQSHLKNAFLVHLLEIINGERPLFYRDLVSYMQIVRSQCQALLNAFKYEGKIAASKIPTIAVVVQGEADAGPDAFGIEKAEKIVNDDFGRLKKGMMAAQKLLSSQVLTDGRTSALHAIEEAKNAKAQRDGRILAAVASAYIASGELPKKLNNIIRGVIESVKTEENVDLQKRSAFSVSALVGMCSKTGRSVVADKVTKNLISFLCVDTSEVPIFHVNSGLRESILSLRKEEDRKEHNDQAQYEREAREARIKRRGAKEALEQLAKTFTHELFDTVPKIRDCIETPLHTAFDNELPADIIDSKNGLGQDVVDGLSTLRALLPKFHKDLFPTIIDLFPLIIKALMSEFSVLRYAAAKCFATICSVITVEGMTALVEKVLPMIGNALDLQCRQGAVECVYHLIHVMEEDILPYVVFLIVPILGRMSDSDNDIRLIATTTFATLVKLVPLEAGIPDPPGLSEELLKGRDRERKFIAQMLDVHKVEPFELPVAIKADLRSYQQEGVNWLAFLNKYHLHGILCDDMGLGKTLQTICIIASDHHMRAEEYTKSGSLEHRRLPSLIICPPTLSGHWQEEIAKYAPFLTATCYVGNPAERARVKSQLGVTDIVITSYDICRNDIEQISKLSWNYCVLDEGHIIKNSKAKLTQAVKRVVANHRLILSGTPIQNNVLELWSLFDFLMPGFLGTEKVFLDRFAKPIAASRNSKSNSKEQEAGALAIEALHKQVLPFLLRRLKEEVLDDLPPKIIQNYYCDLSDLQKRLYDDFAKKQSKVVAQDLGDSDKSKKQHIFQALQYMRKLCNSPALVLNEKHHQYESVQKQLLKDKTTLRDPIHAPKLGALRDLLVDCGIGVDPSSGGMGGELPAAGNAISQHRALIFCQLKEMCDIVENDVFKQLLPSLTYMRMDGSTDARKRQELVTKFNGDPSIDVLLLTTHVGGLGLNLTGADTVIFVEHDWNPQKDMQAMDRAHRIGQKKVVNVYRLITRGTLEEKIMSLQRFKLDVASTVVNQQNAGLATMETDQILDLFNVGETVAVTKQSEEEMVDVTTGEVKQKGAKGVLDDIGELWDESQYTDEYDLGNFIASLRE
ncbi:Similar to Probable helicase mot1; acc. no. O43065 [Pyronema omphalodes CBS 100304]|uniref:TATA-binding protein-associated factor mot1 n=1 Tax=Pyronema omphalodes (strain CBS 100304) TaxID=1076935 RepID=U4L4S2_PYROM|nr:Similar to Probable helicase mot1; acc. no. O43065 [Pyronema omphalodes CBS 100304]